MPNGAKSPMDLGEDAVNLAQNLVQQGISVEQLLKGMNPEEINKFLVSQYNLLNEKYEELKRQLTELQGDLKDEEQNTAQRIERILALMTSNMAFIKQMIQIEDVNNDKLVEQEKINNRQELQVASLIERQNRFAVGMSTMDKNFKTIMSEIQKLKAKDVEHDKFQWKVTVLAGVAISVFVWLMTGDNLAKLTVLLVSLSGQK